MKNRWLIFVIISLFVSACGNSQSTANTSVPNPTVPIVATDTPGNPSHTSTPVPEPTITVVSTSTRSNSSPTDTPVPEPTATLMPTPTLEPLPEYLDQSPPGDVAKVFASGIVSKVGRNDRVIAIHPDGTEIFFAVENYPVSDIYHIQRGPNGWSEPEVAFFSEGYGCTEPSFSPDGNTLYFASNRGSSDGRLDYDLWKVERTSSGWSEPQSLGELNTPGYEFHPLVVQTGKLYFATGNIYTSELQNGVYSERVVLPAPISSEYEDWDPYLPPDESYMIFKSSRPNGYGGFDGYISYRKSDASWTNPKNLGPSVNSQFDDDVGDVSPDGQFLFFNRNDDLYWISADIIEQLRHTNFEPYIKTKISSMTATIGEEFSFRIPPDTFYDDDENDTLEFVATEMGENSMPSWLAFDPVEKLFTGTPSESEKGIVRVEIIVTDSSLASVSARLTIFVQN